MTTDEYIALIPLDVLAALIPCMLGFLAAGIVLSFVPWVVNQLVKTARIFLSKEV